MDSAHFQSQGSTLVAQTGQVTLWMVRPSTERRESGPMARLSSYLAAWLPQRDPSSSSTDFMIVLCSYRTAAHLLGF